MSQEPRFVGVDGVTFRLWEDAQRLYPYAWTCSFCGRNGRTTTGSGRMDSLRKHAAKDSHRGAA